MRVALGALLALGSASWALFGGWLAFAGQPRGAAWADTLTKLHWLPTILTHAPPNVGMLFPVALIVAGMMAPGAIILRLFRIDWHDRLEHAVFASAVGLAGWVPVLLVVGTYLDLTRLDVLLATVIYVVPATAYLAAPRLRRLAKINVHGALPKNLRQRIPWVDVLLAALVIAVLYLALLGALQPETEFDARWYHLGSAKHFVEFGKFYNIVQATHDPAMGLNPYQEILYTGLFALLGDHGAKLLSFCDLPLLCCAIVAFARVHLQSLRLGLFATLAFLSIPVALWSGTTAGNDLPMALYTLLAAHALVSWLKAPGRLGAGQLAVALAAFSFGVKAFGLFTLVLVLGTFIGALLIRRVRRPLGTVGAIVLALGIFAIVCSPWWIRNGAMTGDPIFPVAYQVFHSPYWNDYTAHADFNRPVSIATLPLGLVVTLFTTVTEPVPFKVIVGPLFLVGIPLVLLLILCTKRVPHPVAVLLGLFWLGWSVAWYLGGFPTSRYLLGIAPLACLWLASGVAEALRHPRFGRILPLTVMASLLAIEVSTNQFFTGLERGGATLGVQGVIPYFWNYLYGSETEAAVQVNYYPMFLYINAHFNPRETKVYDGVGFYSMYMYLDAEMFDGSNYGSPELMHEWNLYSPDALNQLLSNHVTDVLVFDTSLADLEKAPLWPYLAETHRTPDGWVLLHLRSPIV